MSIWISLGDAEIFDCSDFVEAAGKDLTLSLPSSRGSSFSRRKRLVYWQKICRYFAVIQETSAVNI